MAIDTAVKRRTAAHIGYWLHGPGVTPTLTPDVAWRYAVAYSYFNVAAPVSPDVWTVVHQIALERRLHEMIYNFAQAITKHDTTNIAYYTVTGGRLTEAVYVGGAGIVAAVFEDGTVVNFTAVAGEILPIAIKRVNSTDTTATLLVGLWEN